MIDRQNNLKSGRLILMHQLIESYTADSFLLPFALALDDLTLE